MKLFKIFRFHCLSATEKSKVEQEALQPEWFSSFCVSAYIENKCQFIELCSKILNICRKIKTEQFFFSLDQLTKETKENAPEEMFANVNKG